MNDIGIIWLSRGKFALVDADDYEWANQWKWFYHHTGYACRNLKRSDGRQKTISMHRIINQTPSKMRTDHRNGYRFDNRKRNLRNATQPQNQRNQRPQVGRSSKYKGVVWEKDKELWRARITKDRRLFHLGRFINEEDAARAYDSAAVGYHGEFARLNFGEINERTN